MSNAQRSVKAIDVADVVATTIKSYDQASAYYANRGGYIPTEDIIAAFLDRIRQSGRIVDIGCGEGRDVNLFLSRGYQAIGTDLSVGMLKVAQRQSDPRYMIQADMRHLPFRNMFFSGAWSWASFHHLPKQQALPALMEFQRILEVGGILFLTIKMGSEETIVYQHGLSRFFALYRPNELKELCEQAGFTQIDLSTLRYADQNWIRLFATRQ